MRESVDPTYSTPYTPPDYDLDGQEPPDPWFPPDIPDPAPPQPAKRRIRVRYLAFLALRIIASLFVTVTVSLVGMTLPYRWHEMEDTPFMRDNAQQPVIYEWVDLDHISRNALAAAIVLEDIDFGSRVMAFNIGKFIDTAREHMAGHNPDGGSTIPQQLVKNMYLSEDRSAWRKAPEALLSMAMSFTVSDRRIMELYMNYAQFGPRIYGVCAASWYYFNSPPWDMTEYHAAQLMAILPLPSEARRAVGGGLYVLGEKSSAEFNWKVYTKAPNDLAFVGGYKPLMERMGIDDDAADHADSRGEGSCSTMPAGIKALLESEGAR
ncbi:transglycosylase domain-containing protein [Rhodococcus sp. NPDC004095]